MVSHATQEASCLHQRKSWTREDVTDRAKGVDKNAAQSPGEKQAASNRSVWWGCTPKQAGLQVFPSLQCHIDGSKAKPVTIATASISAVRHQDTAPKEGKEQGWPTSMLTPPAAESPVPGQLCSSQARVFTIRRRAKSSSLKFPVKAGSAEQQLLICSNAQTIFGFPGN